MEKVDEIVGVCIVYDKLKKNFLSMKYSEEEAGKAAVDVMAAMMIAGQINNSKAVLKEIIFS